jgi:hypothetical protein
VRRAERGVEDQDRRVVLHEERVGRDADRGESGAVDGGESVGGLLRDRVDERVGQRPRAGEDVGERASVDPPRRRPEAAPGEPVGDAEVHRRPDGRSGDLLRGTVLPLEVAQDGRTAGLRLRHDPELDERPLRQRAASEGDAGAVCPAGAAARRRLDDLVDVDALWRH